jgi:hypothetical protein
MALQRALARRLTSRDWHARRMFFTSETALLGHPYKDSSAIEVKQVCIFP